MKKVAILLANGFEELEAIAVIDILRRGKIDVVLVAVEELNVIGQNSIILIADVLLETVDFDIFDALILPGGGVGTSTLSKNETVLAILKAFSEKNKTIGAICAAPYALKTANILPKNYTCYPTMKESISTQGYIEKNVVLSENIITSRGPGTAIDFALELLNNLAGEEIYKNVKQGILC